MVGEDVVIENLAELFVLDPVHRPVIGVGRGVADEDVDGAELFLRAREKVLQLCLFRNARRDGDGAAFAVFGIDGGGHFVAGFLLAAGNDDLCAVRGKLLGDSLADAAAGAGDDGDLSGQIE